ncbi:MAG: hypothetical protein ACKO1J_20285 [Tagaea sp.]
MYSPPQSSPAPQSPAPAEQPAETLVNDRIFIGSNSVAQWFITLAHQEGKPVLIAHQVFIDAPKHMSTVARTLAQGRLFFSLKQVETMMSLRHNFEVAVSDGERLRIERHLRGL